MDDDLRLTVEDKKAADAAVLEDGLTQHALEMTGFDRLPLSIMLRDGQGNVVAGLTGSSRQDRLYIVLLWASPARRGQGLGRRLMEAAEAEAKKRGCSRIHVDTATWQAPDFYKKLGYGVTATLKEYVPGHDRVFFEKRLTA